MLIVKQSADVIEHTHQQKYYPHLLAHPVVKLSFHTIIGDRISLCLVQHSGAWSIAGTNRRIVQLTRLLLKHQRYCAL
jgi:hypothetical protein